MVAAAGVEPGERVLALDDGWVPPGLQVVDRVPVVVAGSHLVVLLLR
ncbi:MAG: hypothetical protein ACRD0H_23400 [Actinomycetes bacterium]